MAVVRDIEPWDALLQAGREDERLVMQASQHPRPPREVAIPPELHPDVAAALRKRGIDRLWAHQAEALHAAWAGPTIVTTGTASGKSLCFNLPTLDVLCSDATVPGNVTHTAASSAPMSMPSSSASVATTPSSSPDTSRPSSSRRCCAV